MSGLLEQIKLLYDNKLYSNVVSLASLVLTVSEHSAEGVTPAGKFQVYVYHGDSLFYTGQYRKAERTYHTAIQYKKSLLKSKGAFKPHENQKDLTSDIDIKYQMYLCYTQLGHTHQALHVLQEIPAKQRNSRINMALAKLYQQSGNERSAITCYKEVLKECPLALEAAEGLLSLGVKGIEVNALVLDATLQCGGNVDWLNSWIKAHAHFHNREYLPAITTFRQLDEKSPLRGNLDVLLAWGESYHYTGEHKSALKLLIRAHAIDPYITRGLDILACLLAKDKDLKRLEQLLPQQLSVSEYGPERWIAMGYLLFANKKSSKAAYLAQKACFLSPRNVEALILKGTILIDLKKYEDAASHFREAMQISPHRYEPHQGLVECYTAQRKFREALTFSGNALKQLGETPRSLTLNASVLVKDAIGVNVHGWSRARQQLEKALSQDPLYLPAVYLLVEVFEQEQSNLNMAISLLEKQVALQPSCKLHQMLGDLLVRSNEDEKALNHYNCALKLDPDNRRVLEGIHRIDNSTHKLDTTYYMAVNDDDGNTTYEKIADSDNEADGEGSETEAVWSDMDLEPNSQ